LAIDLEKGKTLRLFNFHVDEDTLDKMKQIAKARGMDVASWVRFLIKCELARLSLLSEEEKKLLGV
jgi:hypothetical protein